MLMQDLAEDAAAVEIMESRYVGVLGASLSSEPSVSINFHKFRALALNSGELFIQMSLPNLHWVTKEAGLAVAVALLVVFELAFQFV